MKTEKSMKRLFIIVALAGLMCAGSVSAQGFGTRELFNEGWYFHLGDGRYLGAQMLDHSSWRKVELPHDWSVELPASPVLSSCTGYLPGGIGWYRKDFTVPADRKSDRVYIYFEGVYNNSEVFINGKWIGKRPNGYVSFLYDLTPYIRFGERNVIAVRVDHSEDADSRWYTGSGIYRDVYLVYAAPVHIGLWGVGYQTTLEGSSATVDVETRIMNDGSHTANLRFEQTLCAPTGEVVARVRGNSRVEASSEGMYRSTLRVRDARLWSLEERNLYLLKTEVRDARGQVLDRNETRVGIRKITFDADRGFALNDVPMKIKGVCIHHDAGCLGAAVPERVWRQRLEQLKRIGCNAIRMSHNPQAPCVYDLCDELGFLVMDEAFDEWEYPKKKWISGWNKGKPGFQGSYSYFREWGSRDLADMVRRDRNHPSIIMWSIGNEVDYPNDPYSHPVLDREGISQQHQRGYQPSQPRAERLGEIARELVAQVKRYDRSRPVTAALAGAVMSNETDYPGVLDIVGYNYTEYRYAEDHARYPERVLYGSETRHDLKAWRAVTDNDYISGQFIWTGFDYLGEAGPWPSRGFTTGMIDLAGNIKPNGYFRRSLWLESPNIYVGTYPSRDRIRTNAPSLWNYDPGDTIRVVAYTNCESAELYLDDKLVGGRKPYDAETGVIHWDIPYRPGCLKAVGYDGSSASASWEVPTTGRPYAIRAWLEEASTVHAGDVLLLRMEVVDEEGRVVTLADNMITCHLSGPVRLLGLENAGGNAADNYRSDRLRCQNGRLLGYLKATAPGEVRLELTSPLLEKQELRFRVE